MSFDPPFMILLLVSLLFYCRMKIEKLRTSELEQKKILQEKQNLQRILERRTLRLDTITQGINEAVIRLNRYGDVLALNEQAQALFSMNEMLSLPQPMQVFYRDMAWTKAFFEALEALPEPACLPDICVDKKSFASRLIALGKNQVLLICLDVSRERGLEQQREQLLQNLMHDMKTPLTSILGYVHVLQDFSDDSELRLEAVQAISLAGQRLNTLLESLLTLEQIKQSPLVGTGCALAVVWQEVKQQLLPMLENYHITLNEDIEEGLPDINIDAHDMQRMMINLIENVVHHASLGKKVDVMLCHHEEKVSWVVRDYGRGVVEQQLSQLSDRFFKVSSFRQASPYGHGLGLAIVQETMQRYGGELMIRNAVPHGLVVELRCVLATSSCP